VKKATLIPVAIFVLVVPVEVVFQHLSFRSSGWDLGIYHQALSLLSRFDSLNPFVTIHQQFIFNDHFDPVILLFAPLFRIWNSAILVILIDMIMTLLGLVAILRLAEQRLRALPMVENKTPLLCTVVCVYLFNDFLWKAHFFPSHPTQWAIAFIAWLLYYYETNEYGAWFWVNLLLLFMCKEEFPFLGVMLSLALLLKSKKVEAFWAFLLSLTFIGFTFYFRPILVGEVYPHSAFLSLLLTDPVQYIERWFQTIVDKRVWLPLLLLIAYFSYGGWRRNFDLYLIISAAIAVRLLSLYKDAFNFHYSAIFIPFVLVAFLRTLDSGYKGNRKLAIQLLTISFLSLALKSAPFHHPFSHTIGYFKNLSEIEVRARIIHSLNDPSLVISAPNNWTPHLTDHEQVTMPSNWIGSGRSAKIDVWIWDSKGDYYPAKTDETELRKSALAEIGGDGKIERMRYNDRIEIWRRSN